MTPQLQFLYQPIHPRLPTRLYLLPLPHRLLRTPPRPRQRQRPHPRPTATPTPAPAVPSLDEYLAICALFEEEGSLDLDTATYGDFSADIEDLIEGISSFAPPAEVADWHDASLTYTEKLKASIDSFPKDDEIDLLALLPILAILEAEETKVLETIGRMPDDVRQRMAEAGCIAADDAAAGDEFDSATPVAVGEGVEGSLDYEDQIDYFSFTAQAGQFYQIDVELGTLTDSWLAVYDSDEFEIAFNDDHWGDGSLASRVTWEAPSSGEYYIEVGGYGTGSYTLTVEALDIVDDHAGSVEGATPGTVGEPIQGTLDYDGDIDVFAFKVEEGVLYQVDVELGTLPDSWLAVYDSDEFEVAYNEDHGDSLASRVTWEAPSSGEYFVEVGGYGTGSYTLTAAALDIVDDHANLVEDATPVAVGEVVQGALDYDGDEDGFVFEAEEGQIYQIDVSLGTLTDSELWLYEVEEQYLGIRGVAADDYSAAASRIVWKALSSGKYYAEVSGYGTGSYTLTVAALDIVDDHADSVEGATPGTVGKLMQGTLDYDGDMDVFVLEAEEGVLYQIDVELGTLPDSWLAVYDSDEFEIAYNDNRDDDSLASRIVGEVPSSGEYYVVVGGLRHRQLHADSDGFRHRRRPRHQHGPRRYTRNGR